MDLEMGIFIKFNTLCNSPWNQPNLTDNGHTFRHSFRVIIKWLGNCLPYFQ